MTKKFTFSTPSCLSCQYRMIVGGSVSETRYCTGFEKKKPQRFRKSDPRIKPPKWCPRRLSPPICRIYGFVDKNSELMEFMSGKRLVLLPAPPLRTVRDSFPSYGSSLSKGIIISNDTRLKTSSQARVGCGGTRDVP